MTDLPALPALLARVEAATGGDREIDAELSRAFGVQYIPNPNNNGPKFVARQLTTSLDATVALVRKKRPGGHWRVVGIWGNGYATLYGADSQQDANVRAATPELALLAALLRSMIEEEGR